MRNRKKTSIFDKICSKIFTWAAGKLLESLPVIGPIYKVVTLVNDVHSATHKTRPRARARRVAALAA